MSRLLRRNTWAPGVRVGFGSESCGVLTGTEGWVRYRTVRQDGATKGDVVLHWSDPFFGRNSVSCEAAPGIFCAIGDTSGNNAVVDVQVFSLP